MKKELCLFMIVALAISMFAVLPMPVFADDSFKYDPEPPTKVWEGTLKPGESTPWITVKVKATGPYDYPVYQDDGWEASISGFPSWWFIVEALPGPRYTWDSGTAIVEVQIRITIHPDAGETGCYQSLTAKLKPGYDSKKPTPRSVGSGTGVLFKICIEKPVIPQYYLTVKTDPPGIVPIAGEGWYDKCTYVELEAPELVEVSEGFRYRFDYWDVDGSPVEGNPITVHMDAPHTATAHYVKQYYLTVKVDPEGLVEIEGEGWYDECTEVELEAPPVEGWLFVYWDVDGEAVEGNPITVHMDAPHTATAHYWPELGYEQFVTDTSFNVITHYDTVWTPRDPKKTSFKLASTNPGQFYLNIKITNTWPVNTGPITISFTLDPDFAIHPIQGNPVQVWTGYGLTGTQVPAEITYELKSGTVKIIDGLEPGQTVYVTVHMEYYWKGQSGFTKAEVLAWKDVHGYEDTFNCGYGATVPGPFPFDITGETSTSISDPVVVLGLED